MMNMMVQISFKSKMVAAMIYHPLLMIFRIKVTLYNGVIAELRPSPKWTVDGSILS